MYEEFKKSHCLVKDKRIKCTRCKYFKHCNSMLEVEIAIRERKEQEERENCKCFTCVWGNKISMFCPFPRCVKDEM